MTTFNESQKAVVYASLILQDDNLPITSENILKIIRAADIQIEKIWTEMFEKTFKGKDIGEFLLSANTCAPGAVSVQQEQISAKLDDQKKEKKEEEEEEKESDEDMGFGLFD